MSTAERKVASNSSASDDRGGQPTVAQRRRKTGGRQKGTPNKSTLAHRAVVESLKASGKNPVSFFSDLLRNEQAPLDLRFQAAKELAPYMHPKLSSIEARAGSRTHEDRLAELERMLEDDGE